MKLPESFLIVYQINRNALDIVSFYRLWKLRIELEKVWILTVRFNAGPDREIAAFVLILFKTKEKKNKKFWEVCSRVFLFTKSYGISLEIFAQN